MGFKSGNITKLKKKVATLNKEATKLNTAYLQALNNEHRNNQAWTAIKAREADTMAKLGGPARFAQIAEGKGAPPTPAEMALCRTIGDDISAEKEAIGDRMLPLQRDTHVAKVAYEKARDAYNEALNVLSKYIAEKDTFKAMSKEDYKTWKSTMSSVIDQL